MRIRALVTIAASTFVCLDAASAASEAPPARYQVLFERTWSSRTHPQDFPLLAHFSPVIGVTHDGRYAPFQGGAMPTAGIEKLCEEGKHQPLDAEIRAAIETGAAGTLIETRDPLRDVPQQAMASFEVDAAHPMVTIAAMIAPSPDWCAVAAGVSLLENGEWVAKKTLPLEAFDAGTDAATSYRAFDSDMQPRGPIQRSELPYFVRDGQRAPVGTVTFVRQ
ncbi:MAG TPA: spondin domain-containing protein [Myxococcota bacterium]|nr:spondin domain-containing protein [Myxococcota bacterium]